MDDRPRASLSEIDDPILDDGAGVADRRRSASRGHEREPVMLDAETRRVDLSIDAAWAARTAAWLRERCLARLNDEGVLAGLTVEAAR